MPIEIKNRFTGEVLKTIDAETLRDADLRGAYLRDADLRGAYLRDADLRGANLRGAYLRDAYLRDADLRGAYLRDADLRGANLRGANLRGAYLQDADLRGAYLQDADLRGAYLQGAYLQDADLQDESGACAAHMPHTNNCPESGEFTAFKKVSGGVVLTLLIPADAERVSPYTDRKCRASKVKVVKAERADTGEEITDQAVFDSLYTSKFKYTVGETHEVDNFNRDPRTVCASGLHFFITKREAAEYTF